MCARQTRFREAIIEPTVEPNQARITNNTKQHKSKKQQIKHKPNTHQTKQTTLYH